MIRDFSFQKYKELLLAIGSGNYTMLNYLSGNKPFAVIRHDVDRPPANVLTMALMEKEMDIKSTYFFRVSEKHFVRKIISEVYKLGHEIGFHYEVVDKAKGNLNEAIEIFKREWELFREWEGQSICMHGNPLSKFDNKAIWGKFDYTDYNVLGEGYLSMDFSRYTYFSDTGRKWNTTKYSVKDKSNTKNYKIEDTDQFIYLIKNREFSNIYLLTHPSKWNDRFYPWAKELVYQNLKNQVKKYLIQKP